MTEHSAERQSKDGDTIARGEVVELSNGDRRPEDGSASQNDHVETKPEQETQHAIESSNKQEENHQNQLAENKEPQSDKQIEQQSEESKINQQNNVPLENSNSKETEKSAEPTSNVETTMKTSQPEQIESSEKISKAEEVKEIEQSKPHSDIQSNGVSEPQTLTDAAATFEKNYSVNQDGKSPQNSNPLEEMKTSDPANKSPKQGSEFPLTPSSKRVSLDDFDLIGSIGRGAYGEVLLVKKLSNGEQYAMKVIEKILLKKVRKVLFSFPVIATFIGEKRISSVC